MAFRKSEPRYNRLALPDLWDEIDRQGVSRKPDSDVMLGEPILESLGDENTDLGEQAYAPGVPLLVCHGTADSRIDISHSRRLVEQRVADGQDFWYVEFPGATHSFRPREMHVGPLAGELAVWFGGTRDL